MHDWTLVSILIEWNSAQVAIKLWTGSEEKLLLAYDFKKIDVPRYDDWGPSISVYEIIGPSPLSNGYNTIQIQMQSGDLIRIEAREFQIPF